MMFGSRKEEHVVRKVGGATTTRLSTVLVVVMAVATLQVILSVYQAHNYLHQSPTTTDNNNKFTGLVHDVEAQLHRFRDEKNKITKNEATRNAEFKHSNEESISNTNPILEILKDADIPITEELASQIPPLSHVQQMYGDKPIVLGLERCENFRKNVDDPDRMTGPAGMFNSGTNLLYELIAANCANVARLNKYKNGSAGIRFQVPWGKHSPASYRDSHKTKTERSLTERNFMPVVIIKDPYTWMQSLCRHSYSAVWKHKGDHCPNLIPNEVDMSKGFVQNEEHQQHLMTNGIPISIHYNPNTTLYNNMADAWNTWNQEYIDADIPRLVVRFEDLLLHAKSVITDVCHCFGGTLINATHFQYISESAKKAEHGHAGATKGFAEALLLYTNSSNRIKSFTKEDLVFANSALNQTMMELLSYSIIAST